MGCKISTNTKKNEKNVFLAAYKEWPHRSSGFLKSTQEVVHGEYFRPGIEDFSSCMEGGRGVELIGSQFITSSQFSGGEGLKSSGVLAQKRRVLSQTLSCFCLDRANSAVVKCRRFNEDLFHMVRCSFDCIYLLYSCEAEQTNR